jgi:hypothetical protein
LTLVGEAVNMNYMTIEKTFKLTIKASSFYLNATEINALYNECGKALNIGNTNPNWPTYPPGVRKLDDTAVPWPTYPYTHWGDVPFGTTTSGTTDNSVMDWHNYHSVTGGIKSSSKGINFIKDDLSDDMTTIKENNNWRSSVQKALDKLSAKTNVTTSDGTTIR